MDENKVFDGFASLQSLALRHGLIVRLDFCAGDTSPKDAWRCRVFDGEDLLACYTELTMEWEPEELEGWLRQCYAILAHLCGSGQNQKGGAA